ncbi:hypothetical protein Hdeb2414_s0011g00360191 [Helianthus debilis subsp. tardiflorus]
MRPLSFPARHHIPPFKKPPMNLLWCPLKTFHQSTSGCDCHHQAPSMAMNLISSLTCFLILEALINGDEPYLVNNTQSKIIFPTRVSVLSSHFCLSGLMYS